MSPASDAIAALRAAGASVATAESLTGGLVCATLVSVPGASEVVRGGVVAYAPDIKSTLLGVSPALIVERGTVDAQVAAAMACAARDRLGATFGLATTGVAGPDPSEGKPAGTVHIAVAGPDGVETGLLALAGDRDSVREGTVAALLSMLVATLGEESRPGRG